MEACLCYSCGGRGNESLVVLAGLVADCKLGGVAATHWKLGVADICYFPIISLLLRVAVAFEDFGYLLW